MCSMLYRWLDDLSWRYDERFPFLASRIVRLLIWCGYDFPDH